MSCVTGDVTAVKRLPLYQELIYSSPATFMLANLMVSLDSQITQRVSNLYFYRCLEDWANLQLDLKNFMCNFGLDINPKRPAIGLRGRIFPERPGGHRKTEF